jgi:hypothetical protein
MPGTLTIGSRVARGVSGLAVGASVLTCCALLFVRAPAAFVLLGTFAAPVVVAALAFMARSIYVAASGRPRRSKPPVRPGRMHPRPLSPMARRRPRT